MDLHRRMQTMLSTSLQLNPRMINSQWCSLHATAQILWYGDERDRTGLDAQTCVVKATFSYQPSKSGLSHGIRVEVEGYKLDDIGYYASDTESWKSAVDMLVKVLKV